MLNGKGIWDAIWLNATSTQMQRLLYYGFIKNRSWWDVVNYWLNKYSAAKNALTAKSVMGMASSTAWTVKNRTILKI